MARLGSPWVAQRVGHLDEVFQLSGSLDYLGQGVAAADRQARGVIAPIFQLLESFQQDRRRGAAAGISDDPTHIMVNFLSVFFEYTPFAAKKLQDTRQPPGGFLRVLPTAEAGEAHIALAALSKALPGGKRDLSGLQQAVKEFPAAFALRTGEP